MRHWQITQTGREPELVNSPKPEPKAGEALLKIHACGLNFADTLMIQGKYQDTPACPFTPGLECAGEVVALGPETHGPALGTRVAIYSGQGGLGEFGCFPVDQLLPIPASMPFEQAAGFAVAYGTSHMALTYKAHLQPHETLFVTGASGGVGLTAVEIGKLLGARVIAAARGAEKMAVAKAAGADHVLDSDDPDLKQHLRDLGGVDVAYDAVGGSAFEATLRAMRPDGRILAIGFASGQVPQVPANHLLVKNVTVIGFWWGAYKTIAPAALHKSLSTLLDWYEQGRLRPHISHVLALEDFPKGLQLLRDRSSTGKVVIRVTA